MNSDHLFMREAVFEASYVITAGSLLEFVLNGCGRKVIGDFLVGDRSIFKKGEKKEGMQFKTGVIAVQKGTR